MYGAVTISRSPLNRNNIRFSTDGNVTYTEFPKANLFYDAIENGVNNLIPNSVNKNLDPKNLMILKWGGREDFEVKFDWKKSTINGATSSSLNQSLLNMHNLLSESVTTVQNHLTAATYAIGEAYLVGLTFIVNTGTITIDGATPLAAGTYFFTAPAGSYLSTKIITLTGDADVIYEYIS
jgi:hypothetical protein